ncbi:MAG: pirin family protein [Brumimicrobium sp.]|nr:pirin family protein [Brumimicrobium sp.]
MKTVVHKADSRGYANHGWLKSYHTFSFAGYYNPERMHFGVLRVLNDDTIAPGTGFGRHPHDNMEIVSIPLSGALEHSDSMGNHGVIRSGEIQVMSAGTGVTHSEMNHSKEEETKFLQIWMFPNKRNVEPRYDQQKIELENTTNDWIQILSPNPEDDGVWVHQNAWFSMGRFSKNKEIMYKMKEKTNGVYLMVLDGEIELNGIKLTQRDAIGITEAEQFHFNTLKDAQLLLMEIPLSL